MKTVLFLFLVINFSSFCGGNLGHRAGAGKGEHFSKLPENSLLALEASIKGLSGQSPIQSHKKFKYLEFDVSETLDHKLVVFHDWTLGRLIKNKGENKKILKELSAGPFVQRKLKKKRKGRLSRKKGYYLKKLKVSHLKYDELKRFYIGNDHSLNQHIPTLQEFLDKALEYGLKKPIAIELKRIFSDGARKDLISIVNKFREKFSKTILLEKHNDLKYDRIGFLAFPKKFKYSFGKSKVSIKYWCNQLAQNGYEGVFQCKKHSYDQCSKYRTMPIVKSVYKTEKPRASSIKETITPDTISSERVLNEISPGVWEDIAISE